jgi:hypothetical protein
VISYRLALDADESGEPVAVEGWGTSAPDPAVIVVDDAIDGATVRLRLELRDWGLYRLMGVEVRSLTERPVSAATLRGVKVAELSRFALRYIAESAKAGAFTPTTLTLLNMSDVTAPPAEWAERDYYPPLVPSKRGVVAAPDWVQALRKQGPSSSVTTRSVAALYHLAEERGERPNQFLERTLGLNRSTASHWIKLAREAGTLEASVRKPRTKPTDA